MAATAPIPLLHQYFQPRNGIPDPKRSISSIIPSQVVAQANQEAVMDATQSTMSKRGPYQQYTAKERAEIGNTLAMTVPPQQRMYFR